MVTQRRRLTLHCLSMAALLASSPAPAAVFMGIESGSSRLTSALAVSENGVAVGAGSGIGGAMGPALWSPAGGVEFLGGFPGFPVSGIAIGVSADGEVVVGSAQGSDSTAFRWTAATGMASLGTLPGVSYSWSEGVSDDGATVIGTSGNYAFRWTEATGMVSLGPGQAHAVSADGEFTVGWRNAQAVRWNAAGGYELLGYLGGSFPASRARAISPDGSVVVGWGFSPAGTEAFRWTAEEGLQALGDLPGGAGVLSEARGVSAFGEVIVGSSSTDRAPNEAFVWTAGQGMRALAEVLLNDHGIDTAGWLLRDAYAVSADGRTIVGSGENPDGLHQGWLAVLAPGCDDGVDNDGDALVDYPEDPGCGSAEWAAEAPACQDGIDNDGDGLVDHDGGASVHGSPVSSLDPGCAGRPWRQREDPAACGLGFELAGLVCLLPRALRRRKPR